MALSILIKKTTSFLTLQKFRRFRLIYLDKEVSSSFFLGGGGNVRGQRKTFI